MRIVPLITLVILLGACDSVRPPTAPSSALLSPSPTPTPLPSPTPTPSPIYPVAPANVRYLPAPAPPTSTADPIVGRYALDIVVNATSGFRCDGVPDHAKRRTYTADIHNVGDRYAVRLYEAYFLVDGASVGYGCVDRRLPTTNACNQFLMEPVNSSLLTVTMTSEDEWRGNEIWEVLPEEGRLIELHGEAKASVSDRRIDAVGMGGVWFGDGLPASSYAACEGDVRLTFTRR